MLSQSMQAVYRKEQAKREKQKPGYVQAPHVITEEIQDMIELYEDGMTLEQIAKSMNRSKVTVMRYLQKFCKNYKGYKKHAN